MIQRYLEQNHPEDLENADGWAVVNPDGRIGDITVSAARFLCLPKEDILGKTIDQFVPPMEETVDRQLIKPIIIDWVKDAFVQKQDRYFYNALPITIYNQDNLTRYAARIWWVFVTIRDQPYCVVFLDWRNNQIAVGLQSFANVIADAPSYLDKASLWLTKTGEAAVRFVNSWRGLISAIVMLGATFTIYQERNVHKNPTVPSIQEPRESDNGDRVIDICQSPNGDCPDNGGFIPISPDH